MATDKRLKNSVYSLSVGLFITIGTIILVGGVLWLRDFSFHPTYSFTVAFDNPGRVIVGYPVFFRGVQVGRVTDIGFSSNFKQARIKIGITQNPLPLSQNVTVAVREEGFTGQRYMEITPPTGPPSQTVLANGALIQGQQSPGWEQLQVLLASMNHNQRLEKTLDSLQIAMQDLRAASYSLTVFSQQGGQFLGNTQQPIQSTLSDIRTAAHGVSQVTGTLGSFSQDARTQLQETLPRMSNALDRLGHNTDGAPAALDAVRQAAQGVGQTVGTVNNQLIQSNLIPNLSNSVTGISNGLGLSPSAAPAPINPNTIPGSTSPQGPGLRGSLLQISKTFRDLDCFALQANHVLNQRFLGPRLFFGKPGGGYDCTGASPPQRTIQDKPVTNIGTPLN